MKKGTNKIIFFEGGIETLSFFSARLNEALTLLAYETFIYRFNSNDKSQLKRLTEFIEPGNTTLITFNFNGLRGEEEFYGDTVKKASSGSDKCTGTGIKNVVKKQYCYWDKYNVACINIVVDHPFYYHEMLGLLPENYRQISIDKDHEAYLKKYYPEIKNTGFMPSGGTSLSDLSLYGDLYAKAKLIHSSKITGYEKINFFANAAGKVILDNTALNTEFEDISKRRHDIIFTGNYTPPQKFEHYITRLGDEYTKFYRDIIDDLIQNPYQCIDKVFEKHLLDNLEPDELTNDNLRICMNSMLFIDLYVRFYYRGLVIKTIADSGFKIFVLGSGFNLLDCKKPENIININGTMTDSLTCLKEITASKISLNVMPWFKNGAHDRVFNSMLNGAVCLTDTSSYLTERFTDKKELTFYDLTQLNDLPDILNNLLGSKRLMDRISKNALEASASDTWQKRVVFFILQFLDDCV